MNTIIDNTGTGVRLNHLLALNAETDSLRRRFRNDYERVSYFLMRNPVPAEKAVAILGAFLGAFPPAVILIKIFWRAAIENHAVLFLLAIPVFLTALTGYCLGPVVGRIVPETETKDWVLMVVLLALLGGAWGAISGFAGGFLIFIIGGFVGAIFGAPVGAAGLILFALFHRLLNAGGNIDRRILLPLTLGISLSISAFILGY